MYKVKIIYDDLEVLSHIVNNADPPISITNISNILDMPRVKVSRILRRLEKNWWISIALNIDRICYRKLMVLSKKSPGSNILRRVVFVGKTIEDKYVYVFLVPSIIDIQCILDGIEEVVGYYIFDKIYYNKPLFKKYFHNEYIVVDLKSILLDIASKVYVGGYAGKGINVKYIQSEESSGCFPLNVVDKRIIRLLVDNGLLSSRLLGRRIGLNRNRIDRRIKSLVKNGVFNGFTVGYNRIRDMGEQLFWIVFIIGFDDPESALYFIERLVTVPFIGHLEYNSYHNIIKLVLRVYKNNIGYVYDIAKIIAENFDVIDTIIVSTRTAKFFPDNILSNNIFHVRIN